MSHNYLVEYTYSFNGVSVLRERVIHAEGHGDVAAKLHQRHRGVQLVSCQIEDEAPAYQGKECCPYPRCGSDDTRRLGDGWECFTCRRTW